VTALRFDLEWRTTLLTLVLLPVLVSLGLWQLDRAEEKRQLAARHAARQAAPAVPLAALEDRSPDALADRRVELHGHYLDEPLLFIDNRLRNGRYGHDVVSVFVDEASGEAVLLNRGWVEGDPSRRRLPEVSTPTDTRSLRATVYVSPGDPYVLETEAFDALPPRVLVQQNNTTALRSAVETATAERLFPRELRLLPGQPTGFRRDWPVVNVSARKHEGYALQWFTMAAVLCLVFLLRSSNLAAVLGYRRAAAEDEPRPAAGSRTRGPGADNSER
jgi:cytochrome oxidase assembly protein ShyY1